MFKFIIQLLALPSIISLSFGETLNEFYVNETILEKFVDFPCPDSADIAPCVCIYDSDLNRLTLDCTDITSDEELANILAKDFPVNDFYEFTMRSSSSLTALNFTCGGVKFRQFSFYPGPFSLKDVSDDFYSSCSNVNLYIVQFWHTQLSTVVFPPHPFSNSITQFYMSGSNLTSVPPIRSDSLKSLFLEISPLSQVNPGTFDDIPNLVFLSLRENNIRTLTSDSIPIKNNDGQAYLIPGNDLETIEPGAFAVKEEPPLNSLTIYLFDNLLKTIDASVFGLLMPYIEQIRIEGNPLDCGCDLAWIILNSANMAKVTSYGDPTCADGTLLTDLDPTLFEYYC